MRTESLTRIRAKRNKSAAAEAAAATITREPYKRLAEPPKQPVYALSDEQLNAAVDRLSDQYKDHVSLDQSRAVLSECITAMGGLLSQPTQASSKRYHHFFRARKASTLEAGTEHDPAQYSYVPNHLCTDPGRCHLPEHPVFYGSTHFDTAVREVRPEVDEWVVASLWYLPPTELTFMKFVCHPNAAGPLADEQDKVFKSIEESYPDRDEHNHELIRAHARAWSRIFLQDDMTTLSAPIAHQLLYGGFGVPVQGIMYGSTLDPRFVNVALHTDAADQLKLYRVYSFKTTETENYYLFSRCAELNDAGTELVWRDMKPEDAPGQDDGIPGNPKRRVYLK